MMCVFYRRPDTHLFFKTSKAYVKGKLITAESLRNVNNGHYQCRSQSFNDKWYDIDLQSQTCSCVEGIVGKICKHLIACSLLLGIDLVDLPPYNAESRRKLAVIAHGKSEDISFYQWELNDNENKDAGGGKNREQEVQEERYSGKSNDEEEQSAFEEEDHLLLQEVEDKENIEGVQLQDVACNTNFDRVKRAQTLIDEMSTHIKSIIGSDVSESFIGALQKMQNRFLQCRSQAALETMIVGRGPLLLQSGGSKIMHVQPTAIRRRKRCTGSSSAQVRGLCISLDLKEPKKRKKSHIILDSQ